MGQEGFQYLPLPEDDKCHIRLMKVINDEQDDIQIAIDRFPLEESPPFTALSYMWGDPARTNPIIANSKQLGVTESLLAFLKEVKRRHKAEDNCSNAFQGWLWIDAVCINQDDLIERAEQVVHMKAIYGKAHSIIIWLGEGEEGSDVVMNLLEHIAAVEDEEDFTFRAAEDDSEYMCEFIGGSTTIRMPYSVLPILQRLFNSPYWDRSWIIQEASTPKRAISDTGATGSTWVCLGAASILFSDYAEANRRLILAAWLNPMQSKIDLHNIANTNLETIQYLEDRRYSNGYVSALYPMLVRTRTSLATDPRDKLYAILGLVDDSSDPLLEPDYTLDADEVFTRLSLSIITRNLSLDCLGSAGLIRNLNVPSWVTDWTVRHDRAPSPFFMLYRVFNEDDTVNYETNLFEASKGMKPNIGFDIAERKLTAHGFTFDTIERVSCPRHWPDADLDNTWQDWVSTLDELGATYVSGCSTFEAFSKVLTADCKEVWGDWSGERGSTLEDFTGLDVNAFELHDGIVDSTTWHRRLFITKKGYMGIAAADIASSDRLCILAGSQVPMVLRPVQDEFSFVGQAYVHGIMDGEAMDVDVENVSKPYHIR
jgi:hypothetical protein